MNDSSWHTRDLRSVIQNGCFQEGATHILTFKNSVFLMLRIIQFLQIRFLLLSISSHVNKTSKVGGLNQPLFSPETSSSAASTVTVMFRVSMSVPSVAV